MTEAREELGFDPFDPAGWKSIGVDLARGAAVFVSPRGEEKPGVVIVAPVVDREAFRKKTEAKVETIDGREVDRHDDKIVCLPGDLYVCSKTLAEIDAVLKPHDSKLAATEEPYAAATPVRAWLGERPIAPSAVTAGGESWGRHEMMGNCGGGTDPLADTVALVVG